MAQDHVEQRTTPDGCALSCETVGWFLRLPDHVQPYQLAWQYPRIVNMLAARWGQVIGCRHYLNSLLFDERGTRRGFSFEIVQEISMLREYFDSLYRPHQDIWLKAFDTQRRQIH
ncbi:hypothetical protein [Cupriavidus necator]